MTHVIARPDPMDFAMYAKDITTETFFIDAGDPGIKLHVRNKFPGGTKCFPGNKIILFVHGATYPAGPTFDINLPGGSWMDYAATLGYDTYTIDIRGYGLSTRPASMELPPEQNRPFADTQQAISDVDIVIDFICKRRKVDGINLVGWSWGTAIIGGFAARNNNRVVKLVMYAPLWTLKEPPPFNLSGAYRSVTRDAARERELHGIPEARIEEISPRVWFDQWWENILASDPAGAVKPPPVVRAPNGAVKDAFELLLNGIPLYNPADIRVPTLVIVAEWDQDTPTSMALEVFNRLTNAPVKHMVVIPEGTHAIVVEKNRMKLIEAVQRFLDNQGNASLKP